MANDTKNVVAGRPLSTGGVLRGPLGTALPTDVTTAPGVAFKALGYVSEDGLTETVERSTDKIRAWGGDTVKVVQTEYGVTYSFTLIEATREDVLKAVYGEGNVTTTPATSSAGALSTVVLNSETLEHAAWVFEIKDGDARIRIVVPDGQVTEIGEVTYADGEAVGYEVTVEAFRDEAIDGQAIKYITNGVTSA